jgi:hypothetical protein
MHARCGAPGVFFQFPAFGFPFGLRFSRLIAALFFLAVLAPSLLCGGTVSSNRWLFVIETSHSMRSRAEGLSKAVEQMLASRMSGQLLPGDSLGVWTFSDTLSAGKFPLQDWAPGDQVEITQTVLSFLKDQSYGKQARFGQLLPALEGVIRDSHVITVVLVSSGDEPVQGTPFDARINEYYAAWRDQQQKARMPFVIVMRAIDGRMTNCAVSSAPWPVEMPPLPPEPQPVKVVEQKAAPPAQLAPPPIVPPLIISGRKPSPPPTPKPSEAVVIKPEPTVPAAPVEPAKAEAAAEKNEMKTPPQAPALSGSTGVAVSARGVATSSAPVSVLPPPSSVLTQRPPAVETAALTPPRKALPRGVWLGGVIAAGGVLAIVGMIVLWRRRRGSPRASLITRSLEREKK